MDKVGTLWFGDPAVKSTEGNIKAAEDSLKVKKVPYTRLNHREIEDEFHFRNLPPNYIGIFQPDGASIDLKATLETLLEYNQYSDSVSLREDAAVIGIQQKGKLFEVKTPFETFIAEKLVLTPGPYIDEVCRLLNFGTKVVYWNMSSAYFKKTDAYINYPTWFVFQNPEEKNGNEFYGFPEVSWDHPGYIRVAPDFVIDPIAGPKQRTSTPNKEELAFTAQWVKDHMKGLDPTPHYESTCFMALSNNANKELIIDFAPDYIPNNKNIVVYGTGWAGKFVPFMGRILSDLILDGKTPYDISPFKLGDQFFKSI